MDLSNLSFDQFLLLMWKPPQPDKYVLTQEDFEHGLGKILREKLAKKESDGIRLPQL